MRTSCKASLSVDLSRFTSIIASHDSMTGVHSSPDLELSSLVNGREMDDFPFLSSVILDMQKIRTEEEEDGV